MYNTNLQPLPTNAEELERCLADPVWRIFSGCLYKIKIKGDDFVNELGQVEEAPTFELPFQPNDAQVRFMKRIWSRNIILKARQLGLTTLICVLWLDHALFNANQNTGIIAQTDPIAEEIFRDKIKFTYDNLPQEIRERFPTSTCTATEMVFAHNNSKISVAYSYRGSVTHRLHISEYGKICAQFKKKATETITGSIPSVPTNGIIVIESTAEGRGGDFFDKVQIAQKNYASRKKLSSKDYRFHFYAWWQEPKYRVDASEVVITEKDHKYFDRVETLVKDKMNIKMRIDPDQRAWYVATRANDLSNNQARMWQEYPSFPDEAFQVSTEGNYYANDMLDLRKRDGITDVEVLDIPTNTFWDIGNHDGCAIWHHQMMNQQDRFIDYDEAHGQDLRYYAKLIKDKPYIYQTHFLPHDAAHQRLGDYNQSVLEMLEELLPGHNFVVIPRITLLTTGIQQTRKHLKNAWFDETRCKLGIERIEGYKKKFNQTDNRYIDQPDKSNGCSEGADALRQWAQAKDAGLLGDYVYTQSKAVGFGDSDNPHDDMYRETYQDEPTDWRLV
ncbi:terminase [Acinetobacter piscicola]|uniref:Terminase n=1 Tax=Acinetobacter piscicola TaxID=2006115 RepID=A0A7S7AIV9_9GAMM|nr:terminase [Acinetobacter piscicola]